MRGGFFMSRSNIALYEPPKPMGVAELRDSSNQVTQDDLELFYRGYYMQLDKDFVSAKMVYIQLLKSKHLRTNAVILHNISMCDKEIG